MPDGQAPCGIIPSVVRGLLMGLGAISAISLAGAVDLSAAAPERATNCPHPAVVVPANEPVYRPGPTELVSGLYIQGGPVPPPPCRAQPRGPYAGTIRVTKAKSGAVVARRSVRNGHLAHIKLAPGRYRISGRISGGAPATTSPTVTIRRGYKTRQDLFEDVP